MREILFRGKKVYNGEWAYGLYVSFDGKSIIMLSNTTELKPSEIFGLNELYEYHVIHEVDPNTVGQFTGLLDKNGNKIFEGDIVCFTTAFNRCSLPLLIEFSNFEWVAKAHTNYLHRLERDDKLEIIGNKWDNPELLNL